jgi:hypothetical protein
MKAHERVTLQEAAILSRFYKFREPCTRTIPSYTYKRVDGKDVRYDFSLQVPTRQHAVDFLNRQGYECDLDSLSMFLSSIYPKKSNKKKHEE